MPFFRWWRQDDPAFGDALRAYYAGELEHAREQFAAIEDDPVASVYVRRCDEIGSGPLPPDWDGVWEMESK